ncbi:MAG: alpha/beta hydrolase [Bacteroidota bacterium]
MKVLLRLIALVLIFSACSDDDGVATTDPTESIPIVKSDSSYAVSLEADIVYAEGLSHQNLNSTDFTVMPLKLDVYTPDNEMENRPAYVFIHGGGFVGGSKQAGRIVDLANFYTSRGWVFISVDYRLRDDKGTVPQEWADYLAGLSSDYAPVFLAIYPAQRDAKAALRWVVANAENYRINTDYITVGGGSAGAITAITVGISEPEDFRDEIDSGTDPSLLSTNVGQTYRIGTIVDFWGSKVALDLLQAVYGHQRFDSNDPPLFIAHGIEDPTVPFSGAEDLKAVYDTNGVPLTYYPLEGWGHGAWNATVNDKRLEELAFDFIVEQQYLVVE